MKFCIIFGLAYVPSIVPHRMTHYYMLQNEGLARSHTDVPNILPLYYLEHRSWCGGQRDYIFAYGCAPFLEDADDHSGMMMNPSFHRTSLYL